MRSLTFDPLISPALWLLLALLCAGLLLVYAFRRPGAIGRRRWFTSLALMAVGMVVVLAVLLNPNWLELIPPPEGKPSLTVLIDTSGSMATADGQKGATRFNQARDMARTVVRGTSDVFETRIRTFDSSTVATDVQALDSLEPQASVTDLATAVAEAIEVNKAQGQVLLLLSDGIHNAGSRSADVLAAVRLAKGMNIPIFTKTFGGEAAIQDLAIELDTQQELAFVDQQVEVAARVRQTGLGLTQATVVLSSDGKELERQRVAFDSSGVGQAHFRVRQPKTGLYRHEAKIEPVAGEATLVNNYATFLLRVVDKPIRVLALEGKPYWDAKFLTRTLSSDPSIELDSVVRLAPGRLLHRTLTRTRGEPAAKGASEPGKTTPAPGIEKWNIINNPADVLGSTEALAGYQVIVLGRNAEVFLTDDAVERLRNWIARENGSLVCYRGSPVVQVNQDLARLLPVRWEQQSESRFHVQLTDRGRDARWLALAGKDHPGDSLTRLPTLASSTTVTEAGPLAVVLATSGARGGQGDNPVVTYQPYGGGRVVVIEGAGMWRWAFMPPQFRQHDDVYASLWQNLLRWLVSGAGLLPGQKAALRADKVSFSATEPASATLLLRDSAAGGSAVVELSGDALGKSRSVMPVPSRDSPGSFRLTFGKLPEGRYQIRLLDFEDEGRPVSAAFDVRNFVEEQLDLKARPELMARIAQESDGAALTGESADELLAEFDRQQARAQVDNVQRSSAWDRWWVLLTALVAWSAAWKLRRSGGLV